jgi:hypothetical protein
VASLADKSTRRGVDARVPLPVRPRSSDASPDNTTPTMTTTTYPKPFSSSGVPILNACATNIGDLSFMMRSVAEACKRLRVYRKLVTRADHRTNPSATYIGLGLSRRPSSTNLATTLELRPAMPAKPGGSGPTGAKDIKIRLHDDDQQCL